ncbi:MAG: glycosyltransferase, partial [Saprospiraceae bacterium]|nr:glycosyltransferase [Saprospiraceae bacterium]
EIIDRKMNVREIMERTHVTVLLAKEAGLVKAFPHSLIESLASGRPVILSDSIPMADYVLKHECGLVIDNFTVEALLRSIDGIIHHYGELANKIPEDLPDQFSIKRMMDHLSQIYRSIV